MMNHEDFRNAVFEKAEKYKARQKARNKKIAEISCLCSLAFVIAISAYLGLFPSLDQPMPEQTEESTSSVTTQTTVSTKPTDTATSVTVTHSETTATTTGTTTAQSTTVESTIETTASDSESESIKLPTISKLEFRGTAKDPDFAIGKTELLKIESYAEWQMFIKEYNDDYPALKTNGITIDSFDEDYFEEHLLLIVQYAGYDFIAFGSDLPTDSYATDEKYTFYIDLRENKSNQRKQIHILSVDTDSYQDAKIRIWETPEN